MVERYDIILLLDCKYPKCIKQYPTYYNEVLKVRQKAIKEQTIPLFTHSKFSWSDKRIEKLMALWSSKNHNPRIHFAIKFFKEGFEAILYAFN